MNARNKSEAEFGSSDSGIDKPQGVFVPFLLPYNTRDGREISAHQQAEQILNHALLLHERYPDRKIGITYSANAAQTKDLRNLYYGEHETLQWKTDTFAGGTNQAAVMAKVINLLGTEKYSELQSVFQILPVTTCARAGGLGPVPEKELDQDLEDIEKFTANNVLMGWQNQISVPHYAIGGGVTKLTTNVRAEDKPITEMQLQTVQAHLASLQSAYECKKEDRLHSTSELTASTSTSTGKIHKELEKTPSTKKAPQKTDNSLSPELAKNLVEQLSKVLDDFDALLKQLATQLEKQIPANKKKHSKNQS